MCAPTLPTAIDVMRAIAAHHRHLPDDFVIMGLPNTALTLAHCRALAAVPLGCCAATPSPGPANPFQDDEHRQGRAADTPR